MIFMSTKHDDTVQLPIEKLVNKDNSIHREGCSASGGGALGAKIQLQENLVDVQTPICFATCDTASPC